MDIRLQQTNNAKFKSPIGHARHDQLTRLMNSSLFHLITQDNFIVPLIFTCRWRHAGLIILNITNKRALGTLLKST